MADKAWIPLKHKEDREVWHRFAKQFEFRPSIRPEDFPGFKEPTPSLTYSFAQIWTDNFDMLEQDIQLKAHRIFKGVTDPKDFLYVLDWNHTCYRFYPHNPESGSSNNWPVPAFPNGDYYIFLEPKFQFGWLGHPWEQTICIFGERLLKELKHNRPTAFRNPIRQKEQRL